MATLVAAKVYRKVTMLRTIQTQMHDLTQQFGEKHSEKSRLNSRPCGAIFYIELVKGRTSMSKKGGQLQLSIETRSLQSIGQVRETTIRAKVQYAFQRTYVDIK